jgi:hypothetical protein
VSFEKRILALILSILISLAPVSPLVVVGESEASYIEEMFSSRLGDGFVSEGIDYFPGMVAAVVVSKALTAYYNIILVAK